MQVTLENQNSDIPEIKAGSLLFGAQGECYLYCACDEKHCLVLTNGNDILSSTNDEISEYYDSICDWVQDWIGITVVEGCNYFPAGGYALKIKKIKEENH